MIEEPTETGAMALGKHAPRFLWLLSVLCLIALSCRPVLAAAPVPIFLTSDMPSGDLDVDRIPILYYAAVNTGISLRPAVVMLPHIGSGLRDRGMRRMASYLADRGISVVLMTLPYHEKRWPRQENRGRANPYLYYTSGDKARNARSFRQATSDVSTAVTWLQSQPGVQRDRIGVCGLSLGAIVAHTAMGSDSRLGVGVAFLGGGNLKDLFQNSFIARRERLLHPTTRNREDAPKRLEEVDPLTTAKKNQPRHVFMVAAARDFIILPRNADALWNALDRPPIRWVESNHYSVLLNSAAAARAAYAYFRAAWGLDGAAEDPTFTPPFSAWTVKVGLLYQTLGRDSLALTPALLWQGPAIGRRPDHLHLFHADLGLTGRGFFLGAAATVHPWVDVGFASRLERRISAPRPYLSFHFTF